MGYEKDLFAVFAYEFELLHNRSFLVIFRLRRSDIFCLRKMWYWNLRFQWYYIRHSRPQAYHLRSKYHALKVHITRRKANITAKSSLLSQWAFCCVWVTKKIYSALLNMNSDSRKSVSFRWYSVYDGVIYFACAKCDIETCGFSDIIFAPNARRHITRL